MKRRTATPRYFADGVFCFGLPLIISHTHRKQHQPDFKGRVAKHAYTPLKLVHIDLLMALSHRSVRDVCITYRYSTGYVL
ncbi:Uncharacterised protein [Salmonella bongori]|nr:Uncharacterised protein [Salmonella bongori]